jgi:glutamate-ammonia-ligase adenylyltransferase
MTTPPNLSPVLLEASRAQWEDFLVATTHAGLNIPTSQPLQDALRTSFALSKFVAQMCIRRPADAIELMASGDLERNDTAEYLAVRYHRAISRNGSGPAGGKSDGESTEISEETYLKLLRLFRNREMMRIAVRDLAGFADLEATLTDLSALADLCVRQALDFIYRSQVRQWGTPTDAEGAAQQLVILGMGKLGAHELNFSSDIDLIFAYPQDGQTVGAEKSTSNEEFFTRLCRKLMQLLGAKTAEGFVFRVDARLRPFGEAGPLALSFDRMETYYQTHGREWERYALIKARTVAGDFEAGRRLISRLRPFVYRRYLDYNAFESLRDMKQRIAMEVKSKGLQTNIKLGAGGIREIEFFGQIFQLIRGGVEPDLQQRGIRKILDQLVARNYIPRQTGADLAHAYEILRRVENRLQEYQDQQTHDLPKQEPERSRLANAMGYSQWTEFADCLEAHRRSVHRHFNALLSDERDQEDESPAHPKESIQGLSAIWQNVIDPATAKELLESFGFTDSQMALDLIGDLSHENALRPMSPVGRERLTKLMPALLQAAGKAGHPQLVLSRLFDLIKSICRRTAYLSLLCEYPTALTHLVRLSEASPWIAALLSRHPVLLDELLDPRTLYRPPLREELALELRTRLDRVEEGDLEHQLEVMRIFKQINVLRVAASDITNVLPLMKVSDHLSDIAETVLDEVVDLSWHHLVAKHGRPACRLSDCDCDQGFAVVAYGKLGGLELGYRSDLDLVFLHAAAPGQTVGGPHPIDNAQFFARLGQRVVHFLSTPTAAGILYEADMRLRPSGDSGMLVSHIEGFRSYQLEDAWTWEHQALIRARAIAGDSALCQRFEQIRIEALTQPRDTGRLKEAVAGMREKLRQAQDPVAQGRFDIKQGSGGIVDIEFLVQFLILNHAHQLADIAHWTDNVRLLQALSTHHLIDTDLAFGLRRAYLILRAMAHRLNLKEESALIEENRFAGLRSLVQRCWRKFLEK